MTHKAYRGNVTRVTAASADTSLLAANDARNGALIYNESTAVMYLILSNQAASPTNYSVQVLAGATYIINPRDYTGPVRAYWAAVNGAAQVTEFI